MEEEEQQPAWILTHPDSMLPLEKFLQACLNSSSTWKVLWWLHCLLHFFIFDFFICIGFLRTTEQTSTSIVLPYNSLKRHGRCETVKAFKQNLYANPTKVSRCALLCCTMEEGVVDGRGYRWWKRGLLMEEGVVIAFPSRILWGSPGINTLRVTRYKYSEGHPV